jgi:hypothetical protein
MMNYSPPPMHSRRKIAHGNGKNITPVSVEMKIHTTFSPGGFPTVW